jgi:hypothetical protein
MPGGGDARTAQLVPLYFVFFGVGCMASLGWLPIAKQVAKPIFFINDNAPVSPFFAAHEDIDAIV